MNFYTLTFGSGSNDTGLETIIDEAYLYVGDWAKMIEPEPVGIMGGLHAWIPNVEHSQSGLHRPAFKVLIIAASEHALLQKQINLTSIADNVRRDLVWKDRDAGTIRMRYPSAIALNPELTAADSPASGRWTESWVLRFITDQRPYAA